jgi:hypothetical protein
VPLLLPDQPLRASVPHDVSSLAVWGGDKKSNLDRVNHLPKLIDKFLEDDCGVDIGIGGIACPGLDDEVQGQLGQLISLCLSLLDLP